MSRFTVEQVQNALDHYWLNKDWSKAVHFLVKVTPKKKKIGSLSFRDPDNVLTRVEKQQWTVVCSGYGDFDIEITCT
jgi:hypothetical protein